MRKCFLFAVLLGLAIHASPNLSLAQQVASRDGELDLARMDAWLREIGIFILINSDPVKRAIVCRVGFQPFAAHTISWATGIPESDIRHAALQLQGMSLIRHVGGVISPMNEEAGEKMRQWAHRWCTSDAECGVRYR